jgi:hypothetical protein
MTARLLTDGERAFIWSVFGAAIDPEPVRIHHAKWWMWQPAWVTMAPDGHMWFHPNGRDWCADFSAAPMHLKGHFLHEMVHVWQHQMGMNLRLKRPPFARYRYLPLVPGKPFHRYGIEQQAEIVREAWMLREGWRLPGRPPLAAYAAIIPFWAPRA